VVYSRPNFSTLQSSVFIRGADQKLQRRFLYTQEMTCLPKKGGDTLVASNCRHLYSEHDLGNVLAIAIASGDNCGIFPRNRVFGITHMFCQS
jgi:hypothetical protein